MKVQFSPYSLIKKNKVNAADTQLSHEGALVRLVDSENNWGVADLCPWPSLGDLPLKDQIRFKSTLYERALVLAQEDLQARQQKTSLLKNKWIANNILVTKYEEFDFNQKKFDGQTLKVKGDRNVAGLAAKLNAAPAYITFRIDFNGVLTKREFQSFLDRLSTSVKIEYIEDPCAYDADLWKGWNQKRPLARDFVEAKENYKYRIVKPSRERLGAHPFFTITSSMDHPVGVAHALRYAQGHAQNRSGLLTLDLYQETQFHPFFIYQKQCEINFSPDAIKDFGIGMTDQLEELSWKDTL